MARPAKAKASPKKSKSASPVKKQKRPKKIVILIATLNHICQIKDPNAPKRGKSAYIFWLSDNRARFTKPGVSVVEVTKAAAVEWNVLKDKSKWEKMAAEDKKRYVKELASYKAAAAAATSSPKKAGKGRGKK
ncbi:unnamed protein product [Anisakis simplex]|uniref:FACT complex subunit SSRP1 (inferred by orthology to a human protein) n=1 Tax=Anisakis simplex TaxID=6269 RepID=A0A0M3J206_ANISI|nr:unnamed protein product [Anisakis simplex]